MGPGRRRAARLSALIAVAIAACGRGGDGGRGAPAARPPDLAPVEVCNGAIAPSVKAAIEQQKSVDSACDRLADDVAAGRPLVAALPLPSDDERWQRDLEEAARHLYTCRAVAGSDDAPCARVIDLRARLECHNQRAFYRAAATAPKDRTWTLPDAYRAQCLKALGPSVCDAYREALAARDPKRCPRARELADCAALATADPSRCPAGDGDCKARARRYQLLGEGGLPLLADRGQPEERELAAAALGRTPACAGARATVAQACRTRRQR